MNIRQSVIVTKVMSFFLSSGYLLLERKASCRRKVQEEEDAVKFLLQ